MKLVANIVRVSISLLKDEALASAGYGVSASASSDGWTVKKNEHGDGIVSSHLEVWVDAPPPPRGGGNEIGKYFGGSTPHVGIHIKNGDGSSLLDMRGWQMAVPNYKDGTSQLIMTAARPTRPFIQWAQAFLPLTDEHDYGWARTRKGYLGPKGSCLWNARMTTTRRAGQRYVYPSIVTNKGYAIVVG